MKLSWDDRTPSASFNSGDLLWKIWTRYRCAYKESDANDDPRREAHFPPLTNEQLFGLGGIWARGALHENVLSDSRATDCGGEVAAGREKTCVSKDGESEIAAYQTAGGRLNPPKRVFGCRNLRRDPQRCSVNQQFWPLGGVCHLQLPDVVGWEGARL